MSKKFKYIAVGSVLFILLSGCNSGGSSSSSTPATTGLASYPTSGTYIGGADSSTGQGMSTATCTVNGSSGNCKLTNSSGTGTTQGTFILNNTVCFSGQETLPVGTNSFAMGNCSFSNGVFKAQYRNGWGDYGTIVLNLQ